MRFFIVGTYSQNNESFFYKVCIIISQVTSFSSTTWSIIGRVKK